MGVAPAATADLEAGLLGYLLVVLGAVGGILLWKWRDPAPFTAAPGISVFAPLYILAQAIERVIQPFSDFLGATSAPDDTGKVKKPAATERLYTAIATGDAQGAADWQHVVDRIRRNKAVVAWGVASAAGMLLCGVFGVLMLRLVGFNGVPEEVDLVLSGLAVGSGTKPLHDLITNIQQAKEQKQDPPEKQAT